MRKKRHFDPAAVLLAFLWLVTLGCKSQAAPLASGNTADAAAVSAQLHAIADAGTLSDLHWPNFTDYRGHVQRFYESENYAPVWIRNGQPTPQALALIAAFGNSRQKGLNPDEYDALLWAQRIEALKTMGGNPQTIAHFDAALTVSTMRYISDLHIGRVDPRHFQFGIDVDQKKYDLPQLLAQKLLSSNNVSEVLNAVEPQFPGYQRTEVALQTYLTLAAQDKGTQLPDVPKPLSAGDTYAGAGPLADKLRLLGDLPQSAVLSPGVYNSALSDAVKHFQSRHGLLANGKLGSDTLRQLNTPLSQRVTQLQDALERWRWLPPDFPQPPIVVNVPEFVLRIFTPDHHVALRMNVVVGKAVRNETPIFAQNMRYLIFRPYWNVPISIVRAEIVPSLQKNPGYLSAKNFEITDQSGKVITSGAVNADILAQLRSGKLAVRQKPGPTNSLGLVKFIFPNEHNVYLHSTPAPQLFSQSRRDFSHGCIRIERPADLAAWLLQDQPQWTPDRVRAAMDSGPDNQQVNLTHPVPVLILYLTAEVEENGEVYFFDDIYGHDRSLNAVLAKGPPYP
jgi:murein L,D-transpeptidase YcbB/YkuD